PPRALPAADPEASAGSMRLARGADPAGGERERAWFRRPGPFGAAKDVRQRIAQVEVGDELVPGTGEEPLFAQVCLNRGEGTVRVPQLEHGRTLPGAAPRIVTWIRGRSASSTRGSEA